MRLAIISLLVLLAGCASSQPIQVDAYYTMLGTVKRIVVAEPDYVDNKCYNPEGKEDDGTSVRFRDRETNVYNMYGQVLGSYITREPIRACWDSTIGTIYLSTEATVKIFLHELCHAGMGLSELECMKQFPGH